MVLMYPRAKHLLVHSKHQQERTITDKEKALALLKDTKEEAEGKKRKLFADGDAVDDVGRAPATAESAPAIVEGGPKAECVRTMELIEAVLRACGGGVQHITMAHVYLTDNTKERFAMMNAGYLEFMGGRPLPARITVGCGALSLGASVEIDVDLFPPFDTNDDVFPPFNTHDDVFPHGKHLLGGDEPSAAQQELDDGHLETKTRAEQEDENELKAVSYTHLTLPTKA